MKKYYNTVETVGCGLLWERNGNDFLNSCVNQLWNNKITEKAHYTSLHNYLNVKLPIVPEGKFVLPRQRIILWVSSPYHTLNAKICTRRSSGNSKQRPKVGNLKGIRR